MNRDDQHDVRLPSAFLLHLFPGVVVAAVYLALASVAERFAVPRVAALLAAFALAGIPVQLAVIRHFSKAAGRSVVRYRVRIPLWQHVAGVVALVAIEMLLLRLPIGRVSDYLSTHVFSWLPIAFSPAADDDLATLGRGVVLAVLVLQLIVDGIINPIVEERYFRGFLLPQLSRLRFVAPLANTALFALGHFWQPYNVVSIFAYVLPLTLFTWWRRNYYAQAFVHCLANSFGATMALVSYMKGLH
jgi:membrane protease YdiL (CAAX protease family)